MWKSSEAGDGCCRRCVEEGADEAGAWLGATGALIISEAIGSLFPLSEADGWEAAAGDDDGGGEGICDADSAAPEESIGLLWADSKSASASGSAVDEAAAEADRLGRVVEDWRGRVAER